MLRPEDLADELRANAVAGAAELSRRALALLADFVAAVPENAALARRTRACVALLAQARPSMGAIGQLLAYWAASFDWSRAGFRARALAHCDVVRARADEALRSTVETARQRLGALPPGSAILTFSASTTVRHVLDGLPFALFASKSEPGGEGAALAARIGATCLADGVARQSVADMAAVVVGADAVGTARFVNKVGTGPLAAAAGECGTPLFVVAESYKWLPVSEPVVMESAFETVSNSLATAFLRDDLFIPPRSV